MEHLSNNYHPENFENVHYKFWMQNAFFTTDKNPPYSILMPPPNITSQLHMGHALNNTLIDVLIRWHRMQGRSVLFQAGTDHAGIATQNVVEKDLRAQGKSRHDLSRDEFLEQLWKWKDTYGSRIIEQLKRLGCACDWDRERFTLDEGLSKAVRVMFVKLYNDGLIYKGKYIVNWCPRCETALSNEEVEYSPQSSFLYFIRYYFQDSENFIPVATTRPETLFGDTAVAVHPEDTRYQKYIGKNVVVPIVGRVVPVIADTSIHKDFGTGAVKITPAHDSNDFIIAQRHGIPSCTVLSPQGTMNSEAGKYANLNRFACRTQLLQDLQAQNILIKSEQHDTQVGQCYRCTEVIEPYLSNQWFVKMKPLAHPAIHAVTEGKLKFYPEKWTKTYLHWLSTIEDWCISRQIVWGHRIPVWTCGECGYVVALEESPERCTKCGQATLAQETDVLDTWFSSMLWPLSTLGWPEETEDLQRFYPSNVLVTAPEIVFFWVARMIMAGLYLRGSLPFPEVYLHSTVRDRLGRKMSKSLGNGIDPLDVIEEYGTDALRFTLLRLAPMGEDLKLSFYTQAEKPHSEPTQDDFSHGARFANKVWNLARYVMMSIEGVSVFPQTVLNLELADKWILLGIIELSQDIARALQEYRFDLAVKDIYHFIWNDFCDYYVELSKKDIYGASLQHKEKTASVLLYVLKESLKLLHPFMPFLTEEIWSKLPKDSHEHTSILCSSPYALKHCETEGMPESVYYSGWYNTQSPIIMRAIRTLPQDIQSIVLHHYIEGHSYATIAQEQGIPTEALHASFEQGLDLMMPLLKEHGIHRHEFYQAAHCTLNENFRVRRDMETVIYFVKQFRRVRADQDCRQDLASDLFIQKSNAQLTKLFQENGPYFSILAKIGTITFISTHEKAEGIEILTADFQGHIAIRQTINKEAERTRLHSKIHSLDKRLLQLTQRLQNPDFHKRAKAEIIEKTHQEHHNIKHELATLHAHLLRLNEPNT